MIPAEIEMSRRSRKPPPIRVGGVVLTNRQARTWREATRVQDEIEQAQRQAPAGKAIGKEAAGRARTAAAMLEALNADLQARRDSLAVAKGIAESLRLAVARGEEISAPKGSRQPRIISRSGLQLAFERGHLDPEPREQRAISAEALYEAGKLYRDLFEKAEARRSPARENIGGGRKQPGPRTPVAEIQASRDLDVLRDGLDDRQRKALDLVCGFDVTLSLASRALTCTPRTVARRVRAGLLIVGRNRGLWR